MPIFIGGLILLCVSVANAAVLYSQPANAVNAFVSDTSTAWRAADDFELSFDSSISSITWKGAYNYDGAYNGGIGSDRFYIKIYKSEDSALTNSDLIQTIDLIGQVDRSATDLKLETADLDGSHWSVFDYTATLQNNLQLQNGTYWFSIINDHSTSASWYWAWGNGGNGRGSGNSGNTFVYDNWGQNFNFEISGAAAVPIPAAVWLFGSGLGLLGWMRRKPR